MEVFKTYLFFEGHDEGSPYLIDTISLEGQWRLVGSWLAPNTKGARVPEKLVRLTGLQFQEVQGQPFRFLLNNVLPKSVLDGGAQDGYVVATYQALAGGLEPDMKKRH